MIYEKTRQVSLKAIIHSEATRPDTQKPFTDTKLAAWFDKLGDDDKDYVMFYSLIFARHWEGRFRS